MDILESITSQIHQESDIKTLKTSLIDSDNLVVAGGLFNQVVTTTYNTSVGAFPGTSNLTWVRSSRFKSASAPGLDILRSAISISAMHDARQRFPTPKRIPDVYANIKETILRWSTQVIQPAILCFTGGRKSGKSAIAHEIPETLSGQGTLAGTFFFEGDKFQDDGDVFLTLAYQIAVNVPGMDNLVNKAVLRDPTILQKRGEVQLTKLILEPLFCLPTPETPFVVVVDEFDQCKSLAVQEEIIWLLARASLTFGDKLRFVIFALQDSFDTSIGRNTYYWVGRHISLEDVALRTFPLQLPQLTNEFFDPCPSPVDSISAMWASSSLTRSGSTRALPSVQGQLQHSPPLATSYCNTFSDGAWSNPPTNTIDNSSTIFAGDDFSMSIPVQVFQRPNSQGLSDSPMVIDSLGLKNTTSPMVIDQNLDFSSYRPLGSYDSFADSWTWDLPGPIDETKILPELTDSEETGRVAGPYGSTYEAILDSVTGGDLEQRLILTCGDYIYRYQQAKEAIPIRAKSHMIYRMGRRETK